jgi:hypothetical protein
MGLSWLTDLDVIVGDPLPAMMRHGGGKRQWLLLVL